MPEVKFVKTEGIFDAVKICYMKGKVQDAYAIMAIDNAH